VNYNIWRIDMDIENFENWLKNRNMDKYAISSRKSNCLRVEQFEGDLDKHFEKDKCMKLLERLTYTKDDENNNRRAKHCIPINGKIYEGTATLKQAINLYIKFKLNEIGSTRSINPMIRNDSEKIIKRVPESNVNMTILKKMNLSDEFNIVNSIASELLTYMGKKEILDEINNNNKISSSSFAIQNVIIHKMEELGFISEKNDLFKDYNKKLRPDYYKKLSDKTGIIIEVERGKTIHNNMDLLDLWKCHICKNANYLFLIVPKFRFSNNGTKINIYNNVVNRLKIFFEEENYVNIDAVFVFGY
jgi:hypothetical protein